MYKLVVRSRNTSCKPLRELRFTKKVLYRMGSITPVEDILKYGAKPFDIEINSIPGCAYSANKLSMKSLFDMGKIKTAEWNFIRKEDINYASAILSKCLKDWNNKMIIKHKHSSKGKGIYFVVSEETLENFITEHEGTLNDYVYEKYYTYRKEYRLHVSKNGCFYTCRKMLKNDAEVRWHRHENNSVWILEENPLFDKPKSWDKIVTECKKALGVLDLDVAAFDVKVQGNDKNDPDFIILESNTAPALGEIGIQKYKEFLTDYINNYDNNSKIQMVFKLSFCLFL